MSHFFLSLFHCTDTHYHLHVTPFSVMFDVMTHIRHKIRHEAPPEHKDDYLMNLLNFIDSGC